MAASIRLHIEGWRLINHSYAVVNRHQLRWLIEDPRFVVSHRDMPLYARSWVNNHPSVYGEAFAKALSLGDNTDPLGESDWLFRCDFPYRLERDTPAHLLVMVHNEYQFIDATKYRGRSIDAVIEDPKTYFFTPSHWSAKILWERGLPRHRVVIAPHGVEIDPKIRGNRDVRAGLRAGMNIPEQAHVFLNVGAGTFNKGLEILLEAFAYHAERLPSSRLIVKGSDELYGNAVNNSLKAPRMGRPAPPRMPGDRMVYIGGDLSDGQIQSLYTAADSYVSPYRAEGYNMPVLEALAYGLPAIVTAGGSTEDFVRHFPAVHALTGANMVMPDGRRYIEPDFEALVAAMDAAAAKGPTINRAELPYQLARFCWANATGTLADQLVQISAGFSPRH